ncbi:MAG: pyridoxamine 5'-phosphate oxidase family protein [Paramuribaculum sp.]|nr:pyridoxamine 5'-phosphate oxidase family protein [Paramuribaculum sp.]
MRKSDRQMPAPRALEVFDNAPYITMSMTGADGNPYAVPLSIVRSNDTTFYFHCADEGEKIDCIKSNPMVWLSAVSKCTPVFEEEKLNFTEHYRSAMASGEAEFVIDKDEKIEALKLICERFLPKYMNFFTEAINRSLDRTTVVRITLKEPPVGKCKS